MNFQAPNPVNAVDYDGFIVALLTDINAPTYPIALFYGVMLGNAFLSTPQRQALQTAAIAAIKTTYPSVATNLISAISNYMVTYNIPH